MKGKKDAARVYRAAYPQSTQEKNPLELVGVLTGLLGEMVGGRGSHSSTFWLNVSAFCGIGDAVWGCSGGV